MKGQRGNILGSLGHVISILTPQVCDLSGQAAMGMSGYVQIKCYHNEQVVSFRLRFDGS